MFSLIYLSSLLSLKVFSPDWTSFVPQAPWETICTSYLHTTTALPVLIVSKNPISCLVKAPNSLTLILHVKPLMAQRRMPPLQPAPTELNDQTKSQSDSACETQKHGDRQAWIANTVLYLPREYRAMKRTADMNSFGWYWWLRMSMTLPV